jgi:hypothetical protein
MAIDDSLRGASILHAIKNIVVACICTVTSSAIVAFAFREKLKGFDPGFSDLSFIDAIVQVGMLGPAVETVFVGILVSAVLTPLLRQRGAVIVASAGFFASLHAVFNAYWGIVVFFPFVVYSYIFVRYSKCGWRWAYGMTFLVHAIHNTVAVFAALFS